MHINSRGGKIHFLQVSFYKAQANTAEQQSSMITKDAALLEERPFVAHQLS